MDVNKGVPTLFANCEKLIWNFFIKIQPGYIPLDGLCLGFLAELKKKKIEGDLWGKSFIGNV